jgi:hypothetical protein
MEAARSICVALGILLIGTASTVSMADVVIVDRNSRGSYDAFGNTNESGYINEFPAGFLANGLEARNWLRFDIPLLPEQTILGTTLRIGANLYISPDSSEEYRLHDVLSDPDELGFFSGTDVSRAVFEDLGTGVSYGASAVTSADDIVSITLNSEAILLLNLLAHSPDPGAGGNWFVLGGSVSTLGAFRGIEAIFCSPNNCPLLDVQFNTNNISELILEVTAPPPPPTPIAEPSSDFLFLAGLLVLLLKTSRRSRS